ncbi:hypothetical protein F511_02013 [Dorcoceras hygrometricum]|uniref:WRC domain-containing protein n=1 Tax=Dorcoceras hygrometricum TaxID=472368 RepID=A0A2Z7A2U0_9LAMI|nr:hypothetical protein F511_02013 [Dorcoceras hygrometricum]
MRIRKNAKISPLFYGTASLNPGILAQPHVCQLNQSPWDVMSFSPPSSPPYQVSRIPIRPNSLLLMGADLLPPLFYSCRNLLHFCRFSASSSRVSFCPTGRGNGNGSYAGNGSSQDSIALLEREAEESNNAMKWEYSGGAAEAEKPSGDLNNPTGDIILCCKTDGKSWKCRRQAAEGNSLCDHHLSMVRSYSSSAHTTAKCSSKPVSEGRRRPRVKKPTMPSSSNPYEFYYYSGFGPRWGKKRGGDSSKGDAAESLDRGHYMEPSILSETDDEFEHDEEDINEDEDQNGKKRTRKRVKARSLKSLI